MPQTQKEIIEKQIKKLPRDVRDALVATDLPDKFKTISTKHALRIDQATALETETMLVLLGLEHPDDYTKNLMKEANLLHDKAEKIAEEASRMIFLPIRTSLQKFHEEEKRKLEKEEADVAEANENKEEALRQTQDEKRIDRRTQPPQTTEQPLPIQTDVPSRGQPPNKDIFREKLEKRVRLQKEEVSAHKPDAETIHAALKPTAKADPYREPIEKRDMMGIRQEGLPKKSQVPKTLKTPKKEEQQTAPAPNTPTPPTSQLLEHKKHLTMTPKPTPTLARDQGIAGGPKAPPNLPAQKEKASGDPYREVIEK